MSGEYFCIVCLEYELWVGIRVLCIYVSRVGIRMVGIYVSCVGILVVGWYDGCALAYTLLTFLYLVL